MAEKSIQIPRAAIPPTKKEIVINTRTTAVNFLKAKVLSFRITPNGNTTEKVTRTEIKEVQTYETNKISQSKSQLGTSKIGEFIIKTNESVQIGTKRTEYKDGRGYAILETAIGSITQDRNIIVTPIQGRDGTVKEYISNGDFQISIQGKIVDSENKFPDDQVSDIANIFKTTNELVIVSDFLFNFDIKNVVVKSYKIDQIEGAENTYNFSCDLISDDAIEVKLGIQDA